MLLSKFVEALDTSTISQARQGALAPLVSYIEEQLALRRAQGGLQKQSIRLNFICTHNSRRSHLCQVWAQTLGHYYGVPDLSCYSGGTEATALFPRVAQTLRETGFHVSVLAESTNPIYAIKYDALEPPVIGFSKVYDSDFNPRADFAAVMTCAQADADCPLVPGAAKRISLPYEDPKRYDESPMQAQAYADRSLQIATEMKFVFGRVGVS